MKVLGYAQVERRRGGTARVWVHSLAADAEYIVVVDDNEPTDVFGPIFQRAAEEAGIDVQVDYIATEDFADYPLDEEVTLVEAL